jgi:hypothetical protein
MTKGDQIRLQAWRCRILHRAAATGNVAWTCRHFGISRKTFYKWRGRFAAHGEAGLGDRSRTPRHSSLATPQDVVSKILYLRQRYHFGPGKIADYLRRFPTFWKQKHQYRPPMPRNLFDPTLTLDVRRSQGP